MLSFAAANLGCTLEDILLEMGLISKEDMQRVAASGPQEKDERCHLLVDVLSRENKQQFLKFNQAVGRMTPLLRILRWMREKVDGPILTSRAYASLPFDMTLDSDLGGN